MPKLRRKYEEPAWKRCCRYCHYFSPDESSCQLHAQDFGKDIVDSLFNVAESGRLDAVLESTMSKGQENLFVPKNDYHSSPFQGVFAPLLDVIPLKKRYEFRERFWECLDIYLTNLRESLGESISTLYQGDFDVTSVPMFIDNPETFSCKDWD